MLMDSDKLGIQPCVDYAFKKVFGQPANAICLISLLNATLTLPYPVTDVEILNPFNEKDFEEDKLSCVDLRARDAQGRIFVVEIQLAVRGSYPARAVFYACEAYAGQLADGDDYSQLRATYCIAILLENIWKTDNQLHHRFQFLDQTSGLTLADTIEIHTVELAKYDSRGGIADRDSSPLSQWVFWLKYAEGYSAQDLKQILPEPAFAKATDELGQIRDQTQEKAMYDQRQKAIRDRAYELKMAIAEGKEQGIALGEERGEQRGIALGEQRGIALGEQRGKVLGTLNTLEELLGLQVTSSEMAQSLSDDALKSKADSLRSQLRDRC
jgi:predicted transposase/invertase (TIGR01784 family)